MNWKYQKAFTLMELLVTMAIVSILASMATAAFSQYKIKAYDAHAISMARNLVTAVTVASGELGPSETSSYNRQIYPNGTNAGTIGWTWEDLAPGVKVNSGMFAHVVLNGNCVQGLSSPACTQYVVAAAHCKGTYDDAGGGGNYILQHSMNSSVGMVTAWAPWFSLFGCS